MYVLWGGDVRVVLGGLVGGVSGVRIDAGLLQEHAGHLGMTVYGC